MYKTTLKNKEKIFQETIFEHFSKIVEPRIGSQSNLYSFFYSIYNLIHCRTNAYANQ